MKYHRFFLLLVLTILISSCSTKFNSNTKYKLINRVIDSLVSESRYDSIGLKKEVLNSAISREVILNPGFKHYENGTITNKCPQNNIQDSIFSAFNIEEFRSNTDALNIDRIMNTRVISDFSLKKEANKKTLEELISDNSNIKEDMKSLLWRNERMHYVHSISTPIFSDDKNIAVLFVSTLENGIRSWTLKKKADNNWEIFCVEQITME